MAALWIGTPSRAYRLRTSGDSCPPGLPADQQLPSYATRFRTGEVNVSSQEFAGWAERGRAFLWRGADVCASFNNDPQGRAPRDHERLRRLLEPGPPRPGPGEHNRGGTDAA